MSQKPVAQKMHRSAGLEVIIYLLLKGLFTMGRESEI